MKTISLDIETYSSVDLKKCGVFKYAESPDFEILLFGFSIDSGEVAVVDLAAGEQLPPTIMDALRDDSVIKWAYTSGPGPGWNSVDVRRSFPLRCSSGMP